MNDTMDRPALPITHLDDHREMIPVTVLTVAHRHNDETRLVRDIHGETYRALNYALVSIRDL